MIKFTTNLTKFGEFNIWNWPNEYKKYDMDLLGGNVDIKWLKTLIQMKSLKLT